MVIYQKDGGIGGLFYRGKGISAGTPFAHPLDMKFILPILLLCSFQLFAGTKHIIIQVNGTLAQEVYGRAQINQHQVAVVSEYREVRQFAIYEGMSELLYALYARPDVVLHFADSDPELAQKILSKVRVNSKYRLSHLLDKAGSKIFTLPYRGSVDFKQILGNEDFIFISSRTKDDQVTEKRNYLKLGQVFHFFENYSELERSRNATSGKDSFPANQEEWILSMKRSFVASSIILPNLSKNNFIDEVKKASFENTEDLLKKSQRYASNVFLEREVKIKNAQGVLSSCSTFNIYQNKAEKDLSLEECARYFGEHLKVSYDDRSKTCDIALPSQHLSGVYLESCLKLKRYNAVFSYDFKNCGAFDNKNKKIADLPISECKGREVYIFEPQNQAYLFGAGKKTYQSMSLENIIRDIWNLPSSSDLLKLWFPWQKDSTVGFEWRNCIDDLEGGHPIRALETNSACRGDTFYSWGSLKKIDSLKSVMGIKPWQNKMQALYLARTPIGSFGYGLYAVRVKVRADVQWKRIDYGVTPCSTGDIDKTIFFRTKQVYESSLFDIIICSPQVIESWSYGTKEHYDEIVKDVEWTINKKRSEDITEMYINDPKFLNAQGIDGMDFRIEGITSRLKAHLKISQENTGEVFAHPLLKSKHEHFLTNYSIYFNED